MTPPEFIYLLSQRIAIEYVENLHVPAAPGEDHVPGHSHRAYGSYDEVTQTIALDTDVGFERARETFVHENLHAMFAVSQLDSLLGQWVPDSVVEHIVGSLAPVLLAWVRDNPQAVAYVGESQ